jgi:hypothetical protein
MAEQETLPVAPATEEAPPTPAAEAPKAAKAKASKDSAGSKLSLGEKLLKIAEEMPDIQKTGHNDKQDYDFVEQQAIMHAVRPLLLKYGVMVIPSVVDHKLHNKQGFDAKAGQEVAKGVKVVVKMNFRFCNIADPEDILDIPWTSEGDDYGDKGTNKATTIAQKNMYIRLFNIADIDPDAETPEGGSVAAPGKVITSQKEAMIYRMLKRLGISVETYEKDVIKKAVGKLTNEEGDTAIAKMQAAIERQLASEAEVQ